jgi:hypothetical protein
MKVPNSSPPWLTVVTAAEQPDRWQQASAENLFADVWPEYNMHGDDSGAYFGALIPRFADFQALFIDQRTDTIIARGRTIPFHWNGTLADLPSGIDATGLRAVSDSRAPNVLSALAAEVDQGYQGAGLSRLVIATMAAIARHHRMPSLVAPVRPNWKDRYPIIPIERYAAWCRPDGLPFDPWMRVHTRLGARILRPEPQSMHITGPAADWQEWTGLAFPEDGQYTFPGGLAPLRVSRGEGDYWEPNVWMIHDTSGPGD